MSVVDGESVEENNWIAIGYVVPVLIRDEEKLRRAGCEDASVADLESGNEVEIVGEDFVRFEGSVVVFVFENDEAVFTFAFFLPARIGESFGDPNAAPAIEGKGDGLAELRFAGDGFDLESFGNEHVGGDVVCFASGIGFEIPKERAGREATALS